MKVCILDSETKICVNAIMLNDPSEWIPVEGQEVANNHEGGLGWQLTSEGWIDPNAVPRVYTWDNIRVKRNIFLQKCDWTVLPDSQLSDEQKQQWLAYRQQLRDVPESFPDPLSVIWPTPPT